MERPLHITRIDDALVGEIHYLNASSRGGTEVVRLPIARAHVGKLDDQLDAIIACSDLQGIVPGRDGIAELLGVHVAEVLEELAFDGVIPPVARTGVILAGDLFSVPEANKRGGYGEVATVWQAFADRFAWVAGVAGNHDDITGVADIERAHLLDGDIVELDGIRIGGVGGIIGNKRKPGRRAEDEHMAMISRVLDVDILVLHQPLIVSAPFTVCGHDHWDEPLRTHDDGQMLNVDARVVVMVQ